MFHTLKRHPFAVRAFLERTLVLTYAFPDRVLKPLLPAGLTLDEWNGLGFLAVALVRTRGLRPARMPEVLGQDFFLAGFRIFTRLKRNNGQQLRGLRILRSCTDKRRMVLFGNMLTHYNYTLARVVTTESADVWTVSMKTEDSGADLEVSARLTEGPLPDGSPFGNMRSALRFAGPLPFTFDSEEQTDSIIRIEGVRKNWLPLQVPVQVSRNTFLHQPVFRDSHPVLASAFLLMDVPYMWKKGVREVVL